MLSSVMTQARAKSGRNFITNAKGRGRRFKSKETNHQLVGKG
jgi:hypothetical protein